MVSSAQGGGAAFDASAATGEADSTPASAHQRYLEGVADAEEAGAAAVEQQIKDLQASLKDRRATAKAARAEANRHRAEQKG